MESVYPKNEDYFKRLIKFAERVFQILDENNIEFLIYGSFALFNYTNDISLSVNDIDLMIRAEDKLKLPLLLEKENVSFKIDGDDFFIQEDDLLIEADNWGFGDSKLDKTLEINVVNNYDLKLPFISLDNLEMIYSMARDYQYNSDQDKILAKISHLETFLGRKLKY